VVIKNVRLFIFYDELILTHIKYDDLCSYTAWSAVTL